MTYMILYKNGFVVQNKEEEVIFMDEKIYHHKYLTDIVYRYKII